MPPDDDSAAWLELEDQIADAPASTGTLGEAAATVVADMSDGARAVGFAQREDEASFPPEGRAWMGTDLDHAAPACLALARHVIASPGELLSLPPGGGWRSGGLEPVRRWTVLAPARSTTVLDAARMMPNLETLVVEPSIRGERPIDLSLLLGQTRASRLRCRGTVNAAAIERLARSAERLRSVDLDVDGSAAADRWLDGDWPVLTEARFAALRPRHTSWFKAASSPLFGQLVLLELAWAEIGQDQVDALLQVLHSSRLTTVDLSHSVDDAVAGQLAIDAPAALAVLRLVGTRVDPDILSRCIESDRGPRLIVLSANHYSVDERKALLDRTPPGRPRISFEAEEGVSSPWWSWHDDRRLPCDW
jgi:hypothetical protein